MASDLLRRANIIRQHHEHVEALESRIAEFERRYGVPSSRIHQAIDSGELYESLEVCDWIMDVELLQRARSQTARR